MCYLTLKKYVIVCDLLMISYELYDCVLFLCFCVWCLWFYVLIVDDFYMCFIFSYVVNLRCICVCSSFCDFILSLYVVYLVFIWGVLFVVVLIWFILWGVYDFSFGVMMFIWGVYDCVRFIMCFLLFLTVVILFIWRVYDCVRYFPWFCIFCLFGFYFVCYVRRIWICVIFMC